MNVLLLGNGFDLNYKLPTKYINFLNTVNFLSTLLSLDGHSVGEIFGAKSLQLVDKGISNSYKAYQEIYDRIPLASEAVEKLTALASCCMVFYMSRTTRTSGGLILKRRFLQLFMLSQSFCKVKVLILMQKVILCAS